jgi:hypothetical protein
MVIHILNLGDVNKPYFMQLLMSCKIPNRTQHSIIALARQPLMVIVLPGFQINHNAIQPGQDFCPAVFAQKTVAVYETGQMLQFIVFLYGLEKFDYEWQLHRGFTARYGYPGKKVPVFHCDVYNFVDTVPAGFWAGRFRADLNAFVTLSTKRRIPNDLTLFVHRQGFVSADRNTVTAVIAITDSVRVMAGETIKITALEEYHQAISRTIDTGKRKNFANVRLRQVHG